jgi:hypothetical protein
VELRQSYLRVAKRAAMMVGRYAHAKQFNRHHRELRFLRTRLGRLVRDIRSKLAGKPELGNQPCVVCGRQPSHAHHVTYCQPRGASLKVSDEFTVALCSLHHNELHRSGSERAGWEKKHIDPTVIAADLWARTTTTASPNGHALLNNPGAFGASSGV